MSSLSKICFLKTVSKFLNCYPHIFSIEALSFGRCYFSLLIKKTVTAAQKPIIDKKIFASLYRKMVLSRTNNTVITKTSFIFL